MENTISRQDDEITPERFDLWLRNAKPGDAFEYHYGFLALDREKVVAIPKMGVVAHVYYEPMHSVGVAAWMAYERGLVDLKQKKVSPGLYRYFAFKLATKPSIKRRYQ